MIRKTYFAIASAILIIAANYPYFLFGSFSAIGWYDERDLIIPLSSLYHTNGNMFAPEFAGGTRVDFAQLGLTKYSFLKILNQFFSEQITLILYRIIGPILFCIFTLSYLPKEKFGKHKIEQTDYLLLKITTLNFVILFGIPYTYGWILGGFGYSLLLAFSTAVILHGERIKKSSKILIITIIAAMQSLDISSLVSYLPCLLVSFVIIQFLVGFRGANLHKALLLFYTITISIVFSINDILILLEMHQNYFSRLNSEQSNFTLFSYFRENQTPSFSEWFGPLSVGSFNPFQIDNHKLFPNSKALVVLLFIVTCIASWKNQSYRLILVFLVAVFSYPVGSTFVSMINFMPTFRYNQVPIFIFPCIAFIAFISTSVRDGNRSQYLSSKINLSLSLSIFILFVIVLSFSTYAMQKRTLNSIAKGNFWERLQPLDPIKLGQTSRGFVHSKNHQPPLEIFLRQGLHMLDAMRASFTEGRTNYWFNTVPETNAKLHTHRQTAFNLRSHDININSLKLANVEFVFSHKPFYNLNSVKTIELPNLDCERSVICNFLKLYNIQTKLENKVNIYQLEGVTPRVFQPIKIINSAYQINETQYFFDLKKLKACEILAPDHESKKGFGGVYLAPNCYSYDYRYYEDSMIIDNPKNGLVVNHSYYSTMRATCGDKEVKLGPVNGIMTIVTDIKNDCESLRIAF